jgi:hypothetical protein
MKNKVCESTLKIKFREKYQLEVDKNTSRHEKAPRRPRVKQIDKEKLHNLCGKVIVLIRAREENIENAKMN